MTSTFAVQFVTNSPYALVIAEPPIDSLSRRMTGQKRIAHRFNGGLVKKWKNPKTCWINYYEQAKKTQI